MKITTEDNVKVYILDRINKVYIGFDDNTEVELNQITEHDIDLDNIDISTISFGNLLFDVEIQNHFKGNKSNHVIHIHIEAIGIDPVNTNQFNVFYDIPCDMKIRRFATNRHCREVLGDMFIELEGVVK